MTQHTADPESWPVYAEDEIAAVEAVLRSGKVNYWAKKEALEFEQEFAAHCKAQHAVAVANGSVALELALIGLEIGEGAEVVTTPRTFIASASAAVLRGARPIFADVDPDSQNITAESIERVLSPRTRAIIAVHHAGWPCEMDDIMQLARGRGIKVIEDCAQAHGATYKGRPVGGLGDVAAFSFCQDKIMTTGGEGGMLVTDNPEIWRRAWEYKDHGKNLEKANIEDSGPSFRWLHESFGTNWRMTEIQAAIGRIQLRKLGEWSARRKRNAEILRNSLTQIDGIRIPEVPSHIGHAYYRAYAFTKPDFIGESRQREGIISKISSRGVKCFSGSCSEVYLEKAFEDSGLRPDKRLKVAKELGDTSLAFLVHPTLSEETMRRHGQIITDVLSAI